MIKHILYHCSLSLVLLMVLLPLKEYGQTMYDFGGSLQRFEQPIPHFLLDDSLFLSSAIPSDRMSKLVPKKNQLLDSHAYYFRRFLLSGKVLFNDTVSRYVQHLGNTLLKEGTDLEDKLHFFTVRSPYPNAYATRSNIILVNMGLIATVESESDLAFILCHEISHYILKHSWDKEIPKTFEDSDYMIHANNHISQVPQNQHYYSQRRELSADSLAIRIFLKAGYHFSGAESAINQLHHSTPVFHQKPFNWEKLETGNWPIPSKYVLQESLSPEYAHRSEEIDPDYPTLKERLANIHQLINHIEYPKGIKLPKNPPLQRKDFTYIQEKAQFESCYYQLLQHRYVQSIYNADYLLAQFPSSPLLNKIITQALYGLARFTHSGKKWLVHPFEEASSRELQKLNYFFEQIEPNELILLALSQAWHYKRQFPNDHEIDLIIQDLFEQVTLSTPLDTSSSYTLEEDTSKYPDSPSKSSFSILADCLPDEAFKSLYNWYVSQVPSVNERDRVSKEGENCESSLFRDLPTSTNPSLDENKFVFVDPFFQQIDYRKTQYEQFTSSRIGEQVYAELIGKHASSLDLRYQIIQTHQLQQKDTQLMNDIVLLQDWLMEMSLEEDITRISINHHRVQQLTKKYGTRYFVWHGVLSYAQIRANKGLVLSAGFILPPILPYTLHYVLTPKHQTFFYTFVCDLKEGKFIASYPQMILMKNRKDVLNSILYDLIFRLHH